MIGMIDTEGTNKVNYEDFHKFTTGKALAPIGQTQLSTQYLVQKNVVKEGEEDLKLKNFKKNKKNKRNKGALLLEEIHEENENEKEKEKVDYSLYTFENDVQLKPIERK